MKREKDVLSMVTDVNKLQQGIKAIGSITNNIEFFEKFLNVFGFPSSTLDRHKLTSSYNVNEGISVGQQIFYLASEGSNLYSDLDILKKNDISKLKVHFVLIANAKEVLALDLETEEILFSTKKNLYSYIDFFFPLINKKKPIVEENIAVNIKVSEKFAQFYNECRINNPEINVLEINELICRILLCCVIDSMGILMKNFSLYVFAQKYTDESGKDFYSFLSTLFSALRDQNRANLPPCFIQVNYIDSRLFIKNISNVIFTKSMRDLILEIMSLDWSNVNPEILGSLIQSIIVNDDKNITGNFTATANVQKVIGPLFLDDLYSEYEMNKNNSNYCRKMMERIKNICVFDPCCGCGNFLLVAYKELNSLLSKISLALGDNTKAFMPINNFYGIEANSFSCIIAKMGLLFAVLQSKKVTLSTLKNDIHVLFDNNIVNGNPMRIAWDSICPGIFETYIIGNTLYKGARKLNSQQKDDMNFVFKGYSQYKNLDYAACWFLLAAKYIHFHGGAYAFVTTNSLTQGEQVSLLWPKLFELKVHIYFGHKAFKWRNDAKNQTAVTVVIIGVTNNYDIRECKLYTQTNMIETRRISPYLIPGNVLVKRRKHPISDLPPMIKGNMPYDNGYLLMDVSKKNEIVNQDSRVLQYMKRIVGSDEFINGIERWCFWITDDKATEAMKIPIIKKHADCVRKLRLGKTDKNAQNLAKFPYRFREMNETKKNSLVIPSVSSENREYVPVGFVDKKTIVSNLAFVIYDCDPWIFGVISSKMHNLWIRAVCGGLETRVRYSSELGYNTFPFPKISSEQKKEICKCVKQIIAAREEEPEKTYAQMYEREKMSDELRYAHFLLDLQIEKCYRDKPFINDDERLNCLFELYEKIGD